MAFRLITLNLNGIRSAASKGLVEWAANAGADCMGVQEVKAQAGDVAGRLDKLGELHGHFQFAQKKGYSGVGLYTRKAPSAVLAGFDGGEFDAEGRWVETRFDTPRRKFSVISAYFPSGSSGEDRQAAKYRFLDRIFPHLMQLKAEREFVLVGLVDVFRTLNPHPEQYTWWSNRGQAWAKNVGWRLDYHLATPAIATKARREQIYLAQRFSDHAPLIIDYDFRL